MGTFHDLSVGWHKFTGLLTWENTKNISKTYKTTKTLAKSLKIQKNRKFEKFKNISILSCKAFEFLVENRTLNSPWCTVMIVLLLLTRVTNEPKVLPFFIQCTSMCIVHRFEDRGSKDKRKSRFEKFKTGHPSGCQRPLSYCLPYYPVNDVKDTWFRYVLLSDNGVAWLGTLP